MTYNLERVESIKKKYPKGTRIVCLRMDDPFHPVPPGTRGEVDHVDDLGTIHMTWENGSGLALISEKDEFRVIKTKETQKER